MAPITNWRTRSCFIFVDRSFQVNDDSSVHRLDELREIPALPSLPNLTWTPFAFSLVVTPSAVSSATSVSSHGNVALVGWDWASGKKTTPLRSIQGQQFMAEWASLEVDYQVANQQPWNWMRQNNEMNFNLNIFKPATSTKFVQQTCWPCKKWLRYIDPN